MDLGQRWMPSLAIRFDPQRIVVGRPAREYPELQMQLRTMGESSASTPVKGRLPVPRESLSLTLL